MVAATLKSLSKATSTEGGERAAEAVDETVVVVNGEGGLVVEIIVLEVKHDLPICYREGENGWQKGQL
jgi:hypothetical protein